MAKDYPEPVSSIHPYHDPIPNIVAATHCAECVCESEEDEDWKGDSSDCEHSSYVVTHPRALEPEAVIPEVSTPRRSDSDCTTPRSRSPLLTNSTAYLLASLQP